LTSAFSDYVDGAKKIFIPIFEGIKFAFDKIKDAVMGNKEEFKALFDFLQKYVAPFLGGVFKLQLKESDCSQSGHQCWSVRSSMAFKDFWIHRSSWSIALILVKLVRQSGCLELAAQSLQPLADFVQLVELYQLASLMSLASKARKCSSLAQTAQSSQTAEWVAQSISR
jgi:hypothetical protein